MNWKTLQERFEAWAKSNGLDLSYHHRPGSPTVYFYADTNWAWQAWQASLADVVVDFSPCHPQHASFNNVDCYATNDVRVILKRHGLGMKP